jgi:hypothetical protein
MKITTSGYESNKQSYAAMRIAQWTNFCLVTLRSGVWVLASPSIGRDRMAGKVEGEEREISTQTQRQKFLFQTAIKNEKCLSFFPISMLLLEHHHQTRNRIFCWILIIRAGKLKLLWLVSTMLYNQSQRFLLRRLLWLRKPLLNSISHFPLKKRKKLHQ